MVRRAASFLARNGPVSAQDRWEEEPGYSPFTVATEIAALLVAADLADAQKNQAAADYLRETADAWNSSIERWLYVSGTDLAGRSFAELPMLKPSRLAASPAIVNCLSSEGEPARR